jgi:NTE family protein
MIKLFENRKKENEKPLGICLSGGGALGFAHIGVLQALLEHGIEPKIISGTSMGAIVGTLYAAGISPEEMMKLIKNDRLYRVTRLMNLRPSFWRSGWSDHSTVMTLIKDLIPHNSFEGLPKKMFICVSNLNLAQWEIKSSGNDLNVWVSASASIPGVFEAHEADRNFYLDGGLLNNLPAQPLKELCGTIIGVDVLPHSAPTVLKKPVDAMTHSIRTVQHVNSSEGRSLCKYIIEPQGLKHFHEFRFDAYRNIYRQGYRDTLDFIGKHPDVLSLKG